MLKPADTQYDIHDLLKNRWSPRTFAKQPVDATTLLSLFEAARWSPSGGNSQPWSFIAITQDEPDLHQKLVETTSGNNKRSAHLAPVLILTVARLNAEKPEANRFAYYDLGQAVAHLTIQASAFGLDVHQMGGFDRDKARQLVDLPEGYDLLTVVAIGYPGELEHLPDDLREREALPRTRTPIAEIAFSGHWNQPLVTIEPVGAAATIPAATSAGSPAMPSYCTTNVVPPAVMRSLCLRMASDSFLPLTCVPAAEPKSFR